MRISTVSAVLILLCILIAISGCTSMRTRIPGIRYAEEIGLEELSREDYEILGTVTGEGWASYTGLWPIPMGLLINPTYSCVGS